MTGNNCMCEHSFIQMLKQQSAFLVSDDALGAGLIGH